MDFNPLIGNSTQKDVLEAKGTKRLTKSQKKMIARENRKQKLKSQRVQERKRQRSQASIQRKEFLNLMTESERRSYILKERFIEEHKRYFLSKLPVGQFTDYTYRDTGNPQICFNLSFENKMTDKEMNSLIRQISLANSFMMRSLKIVDTEDPDSDAMKTLAELAPNAETSRSFYDRFNWKGWVDFHISSISRNDVFHQIGVQKYSMNKWFMKFHEKPFWEVFPVEKVVVLSPDSSEELEEFEPDKIYIIGGLVDRTVTKYESLNQALEKKCTCKKLPIKSLISGKANCILNVNTVVEILINKYHQKDWKTSILEAIPVRKAQNQSRRAKKKQKMSNPSE
ncbi:tRNA (guanine-N1)-methyltransferase [Cryptosporidium felis]|nr:tRNA (guanine-N1)-methyltransferase [Cryptosporidium felis]